MNLDKISQEIIEAVAMAICVSLGDDPHEPGEVEGNDWRWQDYDIASTAAMVAFDESARRGNTSLHDNRLLGDYRRFGAVP